MKRVSTVVKLTSAAVVAAALVGGATALGDQGEPAGGHGGREPANLGQVKLDVKEYYGDYKDADGNHQAADDSTWAKQTAREVRGAQRYLELRLAQGVDNPAIVLDIDDTSELTYGFNADHDFGYDPVKAEEAINNGEYPAIKPTLEFANWAAGEGVKVYFLTGRPEHQRPATEKNLANEGYPAFAAAFLKPETEAPDWLPCGLKCTTTEYKTSARAYVESLGDTIVVNLGDQQSDLNGGHAERAVKLPNPMYYLP